MLSDGLLFLQVCLEAASPRFETSSLANRKNVLPSVMLFFKRHNPTVKVVQDKVNIEQKQQEDGWSFTTLIHHLLKPTTTNVKHH